MKGDFKQFEMPDEIYHKHWFIISKKKSYANSMQVDDSTYNNNNKVKKLKFQFW